MIKDARILWERGEYRLVEAGAMYHVEKRGEADAMGVVAWRPIDKVYSAWPRHDDHDDDNTVTVPKEVFRGMCERIKEKVNLTSAERT